MNDFKISKDRFSSRWEFSTRVDEELEVAHKQIEAWKKENPNEPKKIADLITQAVEWVWIKKEQWKQGIVEESVNAWNALPPQERVPENVLKNRLREYLEENEIEEEKVVDLPDFQDLKSFERLKIQLHCGDQERSLFERLKIQLSGGDQVRVSTDCSIIAWNILNKRGLKLRLPEGLLSYVENILYSAKAYLSELKEWSKETKGQRTREITLNLEEKVRAIFMTNVQGSLEVKERENTGIVNPPFWFFKGSLLINGVYLRNYQVTGVFKANDFPEASIVQLEDTQIESFAPIKNHSKLQKFFFSCNQIENCLEIEDCDNIESIYIGHNNFPQSSLNKETTFVFRNLKNLTHLNVSGSGLTQTPLINGCPKLRRLDLNRNSLKEIPDLRGCPELEELDLSFNPDLYNQEYEGLTIDQIKQVFGLEYLKNLKTFAINEINEFD